MNEPTHLDLFSGIGGFALASQWAGFRTIGFCEIDKYASRVLQKHWPEVPNHGDIRQLDGTDYRGISLLTGGFPCQPFSVAGKRRGAADDRALWPEMLRVIKEARPAWVLGENGPGIMGVELDNVLSDLEGIGYAAWPLVIPACAVDAKHRRDRVWIVAHREKPGLEGPDTARPARADGRPTECGCDVADATGGRSGRGLCEAGLEQDGHQPAHGGGALANAQQGMCGRRADEPEREAQGRIAASGAGPDVPHAGRGRGEGARGCERGRPDAAWWEPEPDVGRVAHGIPHRVDRLKGLGNAIVPQVAYQILKEIRRMI